MHILRALLIRQQVQAALISLETLQQLLASFGYPMVFLFVMIESIGIPIPGETMLLLGSFYAAIDHRLNIVFVIVCAAVGAIVGDNIGFVIGRKGGRPFVERYGKYVFIRQKHLAKAEQFFEHHGGKTVFLGRFTAILRAWAAFLAGVNHMPWRAFLIYNATGGILWATIVGLVGYYAGRIFHENFAQVEHLVGTAGWIIAGVVVLGAILAYVITRLRKKNASTSPSSTKENHHQEPEH
ncbi:membrane protein [Ktedonobacter sp. SOSP1-52]|uniref:DedA family protein n=1 Tax=Ktedonobacter sp. SOSP1-52 TaxID=2778366 RepID=UPI00191584F1|nr:DedA family protein [Ktedonobacter sp. SOSP1-52]GHO65862.1 membrane protein [Ktedonobacter sp. SOSP1-52]